jgi:hypothetical protein
MARGICFAVLGITLLSYTGGGDTIVTTLNAAQ